MSGYKPPPLLRTAKRQTAMQSDSGAAGDVKLKFYSYIDAGGCGSMKCGAIRRHQGAKNLLTSSSYISVNLFLDSVMDKVCYLRRFKPHILFRVDCL